MAFSSSKSIQHRCFYPASKRWMDPMCPLPKKGTSYRDIHRLVVTMRCSHKLLNFAPYMKETSLFWVMQTCHVFLLFGVEAGVILFWVFCFPSWLLKCCNLQPFLATCTYFTLVRQHHQHRFQHPAQHQQQIEGLGFLHLQHHQLLSGKVGRH